MNISCCLNSKLNKRLFHLFISDFLVSALLKNKNKSLHLYFLFADILPLLYFNWTIFLPILELKIHFNVATPL